ncbi:MAG: hypothetical protein GY862_13385 [Gammaproteobacteria bacterium]|nr:hypothetical protein [Gammaproteobacteria bacterium]
MKEEVKDSVTGKSYSLGHLEPFQVSYAIKMNNIAIDVNLHVFFTSHCYTRSRKEGDSDCAVLYRERKRGGIDERVFSKARWEFSKFLPDIIKSLHSKGCYPGSKKELFFRQEKPPYAGSQDGWYICFRLGVSKKHKNLTMSVRSVHWRNNRPYVRRVAKRFYALLSEFYSEAKKKMDWL